jgi:hypothetical protein
VAFILFAIGMYCFASDIDEMKQFYISQGKVLPATSKAILQSRIPIFVFDGSFIIFGAISLIVSGGLVKKQNHINNIEL